MLNSKKKLKGDLKQEFGQDLGQDRVLTVPNVLTVLRILAGPVLFFFAKAHSFEWAFIVFCLASVTDWFDGFIARHFHQESSLGRLMDPFADKWLTLCVYGVLIFEIPVLFWIVIGRDVLITLGVLVAKICKKNLAISPIFISKVNTALLSLIPGFIFGFKAGYLEKVLSFFFGKSAGLWVGQGQNFHNFFIVPASVLIVTTTILSLYGYIKVFVKSFSKVDPS